MSSNKRLRVGLIGAGTIAFSAHLPAIRRLRDQVELVAVADVRAENAERAAREFGAQHYYTDYHELLARDDLDMVDICTPEFLHAEQTEAAAAAGLHVFCEKPMAATVEEADRMIAACTRAGVRLMIGHSRRFTGRYQQIRAAIDRGDIGEVRYVRENERRPRAMYDSLNLGTGYWNPEAERPWLTMARYSQGAALTNAVHETDLARWFVGSQPVSVFAEARITEEGAEVPDMLSYTITFENGAVAAAEVGAAAGRVGATTLPGGVVVGDEGDGPTGVQPTARAARANITSQVRRAGVRATTWGRRGIVVGIRDE